MPVATFPGERGWGYDGVYTLRAASGVRRADGLAASSTPRTARGSASSSTSSTTTSAPATRRCARSGRTSPTASTRSGATRSTTRSRVREWAIQNAELWVRDYRIDGLRLDAVHAIHDDSPRARAHRACRARARGRPRALVISEMERRRLPAARRVGTRRDVARRPPPRAPRRPDRRARRVLRRRTARWATRAGTRRGPSAGATRRRRPEPRPGRQPCGRRPAARASHSARLGGRPVLVAHAAALHGRGARRDRTRSSSSPTTSTR